MTSSVEGTPDTEVTIYNNDDQNSAQTNWVHFVSTEVDGSLPAPIKLTLTNADADDVDWSHFYIAHNVINDPSTLDHWLLGSQAEEGAGDSWTGAQTTWHEAHKWELTAAQCQDTRGTFFRILWAGSCSTGTWMRARVGVGVADAPGGLRLTTWYGDAVPITTSNSQVWDLGALPLPPGGYALDYKYVEVGVDIISTASGSATCDCLMLAPASTGLRKFYMASFFLSQGDFVVDDGIEGRVYSGDSGQTYTESVVSSMSAPVMLWPGVLQRLYILMNSRTNWSSVAGKALTVKAAYRPRKLSV
jgi:hypothetical protein